MKKLSSILIQSLRAIFITIILGIPGCVVGIGIDKEFQGGIFSWWKLITVAPQPNMILSGVLPCANVTDDYRVIVWLTDSTDQAWQYSECNKNEWEKAPEVPSFEQGVSFPCKIGDDSQFSLAESRLPGNVEGCWEITWNWEVFYIGSRYMHLSDGKILSWTIGDGLASFVRGAIFGWSTALLLTIALLTFISKKK